MVEAEDAVCEGDLDCRAVGESREACATTGERMDVASIEGAGGRIVGE